jgi:hypothetical protein
MWSDKVERWRDVVSSELTRQRVPLPADLVLGLIHVESRGYPGNANPKSGASGLLQVIPGTLEWYNERNPRVSLEQLRSPNHPTEQIRVGIWVLAQFWHGAYRYLRSRLADIPVDELAKVADLYYVAGPGSVNSHLAKVDPPFLSALEARYPSWNALPHPRNVWAVLPAELSWDLPGIAKWLETSAVKSRKAEQSAIVLLGLAGVAYYYFIKRKKS